MTKRQYKAKLLWAGVRNLKEFGYPSATSENIVTDYVFAPMFRSMLDNDANTEAAKRDSELAAAMDELRHEIDAAEKAVKP